jgi:hypothetical protein
MVIVLAPPFAEIGLGGEGVAESQLWAFDEIEIVNGVSLVPLFVKVVVLSTIAVVEPALPLLSVKVFELKHGGIESKVVQRASWASAFH